MKTTTPTVITGNIALSSTNLSYQLKQKYMKTQFTKMCGVMLFALLTMFGAKAQIYQQQFAQDSATFNTRAMANGLYVNSSAASNSQLTYLFSSAATATIGVSGGTLNLTRPGTGTL